MPPTASWSSSACGICLHRRRDDDAVERRMLRQAVEAVAEHHLDIVVAELAPALARAVSASVR